MNYRLIVHQIINVYRQDLRLFRPRSFIFSRSLTTQLTAPTRRWAIKRYVLIIGLPLTSFLVYRLSTNLETRRKHNIVLGSIGRAIQ
jgi:hypothetical protein